MRRKKWDSGNVVEIKLKDGSFAYGVIVRDPLLVFSSLTFSEKQDVSPELFKDIAFQLWVMNSAIGKKGWPVVGNIFVEILLMEKPVFYRFDKLSKKFFHYVDCINDIPSTREGCSGLECAAIWERGHVEDRLMALKNGVDCEWVKAFRAENRV